MISAKVIEDSISSRGKRLTTLELSYPRFIHGEVMTHRVFSRNAMSSRAIPVAKMIQQVRYQPVVPLHWGMNQPGMQAATVADVDTERAAQRVWLRAAVHASEAAQQLNAMGLHKQVANRLLEPFQWMKTIVTATEWDNFFELRIHKDAEPHMRMLAEAMKISMDASQPVTRGALPYETPSWHLPYVLPQERESNSFLQLTKVSAARCARVSYLTHDNAVPSLVADLALFDRLAGGVPIHASPLEHQAFPVPDPTLASGNFLGWVQYRQVAGTGANHAQ